MKKLKERYKKFRKCFFRFLGNKCFGKNWLEITEWLKLVRLHLNNKE